MKIKVQVPLIGSPVSLDDNKDFIARGGQAAIYGKGQYAFKIYHDRKSMIPVKKIQELKTITMPNVLNPLDIIYDSKKQPIGYIMSLVGKGHPMCKLFTKNFKINNGVDAQDIVDIVTRMQTTVSDIHKLQFLIVDLNELNLMVSDDFTTPIFLDVDSYQTPTFPADALMESVRDPLVTKNQFTEFSDWYSWAVVSFQLYIGIHPYKGSHPSYKRKDWRKRMDDGVSVFDKDAGLPTACLPFTVIPQRHLDWYKAVFVKNERTVPPLAGSIAPVGIILDFTKIIKSGNFDSQVAYSFPDQITRVFTDMGITYIATTAGLYRSDKQVVQKKSKHESYILIINGKPIIVQHYDKKEIRLGTIDKKFLVSQDAQKVMYKDNRMYSVYLDNLFEHNLATVNGHICHTKKRVASIISNQATIHDGVIIQESLDTTIAIIPFETGKCITKQIPELKEYRIISAKAESNVMVVLCEKNGEYHRLVFVFDEFFSQYDVRLAEDVPYTDINFTVLPGGPCILVSGDSEIEIFKDNSKVKIVDNPPFDSSMKLFNINGRVHYINGNKVYSATMK